jgi:proline-specific peptidase
MSEGFVTVHGLRLFYRSEGSGQPLVILHGGPGLSHDYFLPDILGLAAHVHLVLFDQRGCGRSDHCTDPREYTIDNMARDVEELRQALNLGPIALLGHSYGGMLAQVVALQYPESLTHLILVSTFASTRDLNERLRHIKGQAPRRLREVVERREREGLFKTSDRYPPDYEEAAMAICHPYFFRGEPPAAALASLAALNFDLYRTMWGQDGEFVVTGNLRDFDLRARLSAISAPTMVIQGRYDLSSPENGEQIRQRIPGARLVTCEKSAHFPFLDEPAYFMETIHKFLAGTLVL